jgi:GT2 family glycosyltransferase
MGALAERDGGMPRSNETAVGDSIAVVVLTYNRVHLLRQCVENVLSRTSGLTKEIIVWNNASGDGTREYLDTIDDPRFTIVHHPENIGLNAYALAFPMTSSPYLLELDDDIVDAPPGWDADLLAAYKKLPAIGYLQAKLADDGHSPGAHYFYRERAHLYTLEEQNGVRVWCGGPVGGGCTITSRELHDRVGGFRQHKKLVFWREDQAYIEDIRKLGYTTAILDEVTVFHAGGEHYSEIVGEKKEFYDRRERTIARKNAVKRLLLRIPLVPRLNARFGWFRPPEACA